MNKKYERWAKSQVIKGLQSRRIVILAGPRQCGKTTLAKEMGPEGVIFRTLDDLALLEGALEDPHGFVKHAGGMMIIDEIQRAPSLLPAIKKVVDDDDRKGQYLITGSANITTLPGVTESLAGRAKKVRLRTLSQGEIAGATPSFFDQVGSGAFNASGAIFDRDRVIEVALKGGFPEALALDAEEGREWHRDYLDVLLERDLQDIINIKRMGTMADLAKVLAAWSGKHMNLSEICSSLAVDRVTLSSYIKALEAMYLVEQVNPWIKTDYERVGKQSKMYFTDTGLMSTLLNWKQEAMGLDSDKVGKLVETLVFHELSIQVDLASGYSLYHYRDREKREIDFVVESEDGGLIGIEVKAGSAVKGDHFKHLRWFSQNIAKNVPFYGIVLYTGEQAIPFGDDMLAVPMGCLWS